MSQNKNTKPYQSLIHLGCGEAPYVDEYLALAEQVWLIDADSRAIEDLGEAAGERENLHIVHALADTEERAATFYRYSLPWANGLVPVSEATQQLYPGLRTLENEEQTTTPVDRLLSQCLPQHEDPGEHMLLLDLGDSNSDLMQALEETGLLARLHTVIVLPAHRRQSPVAVPPSLYPAEAKPESLTLPDNAQVLQRHPLLFELEQAKQKLTELRAVHENVSLQLDEAADKLQKKEAELENRTTERDWIQQQLMQRDEELAVSIQQLEESKRNIEQQGRSHAQALTLEQEKTAQVAQERDQYLRERDEEWNKGERLAKERDDLQQQLEQAIKARDDALHQNHLNHQARSTAENRISELEHKLAEADSFRESFLASLKDKISATNEVDGFYRALEDEFRGAREEVKRRVSVYLPFVRPVAERHPGMPALDLGCGRGELLEVLKEAEIPGEGIDQDAGMLEGCQALGLSVQQGDAIAYLRTQADASRICVSLIHVVEHIPFDTLRDIVAEAKRVLVPDGILIMETPNPENYTVGSCNFYMDPTHRNPLPPPLLAFVPKYYGFQKIKILRLQERDEIRLKTRFTVEDYLTNVSPDYAVVARLASSNEVELTPKESDFWDREYGVSLPFIIKRSEQEASANE